MSNKLKKSLVIVESPAKAKTINKYLGNDYVVTSSVGHIRDLPKNELGVDLENDFTPKYVNSQGKSKIISQIKKLAASSDKVYIATDNDREGEAIGWHISHIVQKSNKNIYRVLFNEITKNAIQASIQKPGKIDLNRVDAQQARRIMDRIVGYKISPFLWKAVSKGLSAGRVQSVALKIICERDAEIAAFNPVEYWSIVASLENQEDRFLFEANLVKIDGKTVDKDKNRILDEKNAEFYKDEILKNRFVISSIEKKTVKRNPYPPFTTSTLQQEASKRLRFSSKFTMSVAQQLYEGMEIGTGTPTGLITYMRTDSLRISEEALNAARETILNEYGKPYLPASPMRYKTSKGAQDAHEAIRPTSLLNSPQKIKRFLTQEQFKLYSMIWNRFLASQMSPALEDRTTVNINSGEKYLFRATGSILKFDGFLRVFDDTLNDEKDGEKDVKLSPLLKEGNELNLKKLDTNQHFTKPPGVFRESSIIKELDRLGIGRPSTYSSIISTILDRGYVEKKDGTLISTELGRLVNGILVESFPNIFNVKFTAEMESELDKIENGANWVQIMKNFYDPFSSSLLKIDPKSIKDKKVIEEIGEKCPNCQNELIYRMSKHGKFIGCSNFPECKYTRPFGVSADEAKARAEAPKKQSELVGESCPKCKSDLVFRNGKSGKFIGCSNYPKCNHTAPIPIDADCPKCGKKLATKRSHRMKTFYGCEGYPECDFVAWDKVLNENCPNCGNNYILEKNTRQGNFLECPKCKGKMEIPKEKEEA